MVSPHFTHAELACPASGRLLLAEGFLASLERLRHVYDKPMTVNSCCRTAAYNKQIGGHPRSLHVVDKPYYTTGGCCAIDIAMPDGADKGKLILLAWLRGWSIGINKTFLHLDRRTEVINLPQIIFTY